MCCQSWLELWEVEYAKTDLALQYGFWLWRDGSTASYVQLIADSKSFTYICVNHTKALQDTITEIVIKYPGQVCQPLFLDTLIMEDVLASYRLALAGYRDELREIVSELQSLISTFNKDDSKT